MARPVKLVPTVMAFTATSITPPAFPNAARALGNAGGVIEVAVNAITVGTNFTGRAIKLKEGHYLRLTFSDNGCGMDEATMARIFEPFFTTQAHGEGAGLGLAMVDGIMRSHGGSVTVYSELGKGSVFSLYFPVIEQKKELAGATAVPSPRGQGQRLMYVDDEQALVRLVTHALQR